MHPNTGVFNDGVPSSHTRQINKITIGRCRHVHKVTEKMIKVELGACEDNGFFLGFYCHHLVIFESVRSEAVQTQNPSRAQCHG